MAVHKVKRSNPSTQLQPQHAKTARTATPDRAKAARSGNPGGRRRAHNTQTNPLLTPQLFDVLQNLNRGYGMALINLDNLELINTTARPRIIPSECLRDIRNQTEQLRALANRELLAVLSGRNV